MSTKLSIIIINWNGMQFLPECLQSLKENPPCVDYEVVIVDNCSTDASRDWLMTNQNRLFSSNSLRVILSDENLGFGRANNLAIERTKGEYVFILNPDTLVKKFAIDRLIAELNCDDRIGAVSPKLLNTDGSLQESVTYFPPNPIKTIMQAMRVVRFLPKNFRAKWFYGQFWDHNEKISVPVFWGTAILAKREMIEQVGAFDPDFFMYGEDVEWCARINKNGWKTVFVPDAEVIHLGGKSSEQAWKITETSLRKVKADILTQEKSTSPYLFFVNSITKAIICGAIFLFRRVLRKESDFIFENAVLHVSAAKKALRKLFRKR